MVNYWVHNGFVRVDNEKMSKSLGNFFTIRDVLKKYDAEVVRFFILRAHYRSPLNYSDAHLDDARGALTRLYTALDGVEGDGQPLDWQGEHAAASPKRWTMTSIRRWRWPRCSIWHRAEQVEIAALARPAESAGRRDRPAGAHAAAVPAGVGRRGDGAGDAAIAKPSPRAAAKKARNFAESDRSAPNCWPQGIILEDKPDGTTNWRRA
jgi:cysteinyl-tRNA synthetase